MARVVLAMSGGVDSSVAAWLLREQGHEVIGLFMRHGQQPKNVCDGSARHKQGCCSAADAADARRVADMLGIPFYAVNFEAEFGRIVDYFVEAYIAGRTPNPCIVCNTWLKFGRLFEYADSVGAEFVATGHYARLEGIGSRDPSSREPAETALCRGRDLSKDQSYVLFGIDRSLLKRLMFPVGTYGKDEIRRIAGRLGLRVAGKRDSQEICFVPDQDHARFVKEHCGEVPTSGEIVTMDGTVVGRHEGLERFTIGQRKGLGVAFGEPRYVVRIDRDTRRVVVGTKEDLARKELAAQEANWLIEESTGSLRCQVKIRYRSRPADATVEFLPGNRFRIRFAEPCYGVAPGQAAVCYDGERVLGGGWIE
ncbi:MAG TPA: tRNA 2-thiouridine(34) synthase MnmA [Thermoguttaceae bacterium]|nr:tRNA 2-thiouridine(34) synthase MnmA [Thermoguttaceae bacterium]